MKQAPRNTEWRQGLTGKQAAFVESYCGKARWNATEAVMLAGYDTDRATAGQIGYENLKKPEVVDAIAEYNAQAAYRAELTVEGIIADIQLVLDCALGRNGQAAQMDIAGNAVLQLGAANKSLELLGKVKAMFTDRTEIRVPDEVYTVHLAAALGESSEVPISAIPGIVSRFMSKVNGDLSGSKANRNAP